MATENPQALTPPAPRLTARLICPSGKLLMALTSATHAAGSQGSKLGEEPFSLVLSGQGSSGSVRLRGRGKIGRKDRNIGMTCSNNTMPVRN